MDQPPPSLLTSNDQIEISADSINEYDYYSNGLLQPEDTFQQNPCSCNNCLSNASNFQLPYDNDSSNYMNISESPPPSLMQPQQQHNIEQTSPISSTVEQCINNNINNDQQFIEHVQPQSIPNISSPSLSPHNNNNNLSPHSPPSHNNLCANTSSTIIDSQTGFTELFRVEISGVEIIFRKKILLNPNSNHNLETRNSPYNEQSPGIRAGRIQYRVHPYQMPAAENCRYNKINYRNPIYPNYPNYIQKQYYPHFTPQLHPQIIDSYQ